MHNPKPENVIRPKAPPGPSLPENNVAPRYASMPEPPPLRVIRESEDGQHKNAVNMVSWTAIAISLVSLVLSFISAIVTIVLATK